MRKRRLLGATATATAALAAVLIPASPANAYTTYTDDQCSSNTSCFAIFFNSMQNIGVFRSPCFITNKTEDSHLGYDYLTSSGMQQVRYQFNYGNGFGFEEPLPNSSKCEGALGSGYSVKNNAAGASNGDSRNHRVFYYSNQQGTYQTIESGANENLIAALKNENASSARL
ncbi:hypothetical protein OG814_32365 [Streptomyces zaomyceticus]|uniref:Peptidase inhibitor family I36 n=1 Tax=Streptomyces zaomyceticus TaxID=68286 RepID=A0ABZ1LGP1_9ACTN